MEPLGFTQLMPMKRKCEAHKAITDSRQKHKDMENMLNNDISSQRIMMTQKRSLNAEQIRLGTLLNNSAMYLPSMELIAATRRLVSGTHQILSTPYSASLDIPELHMAILHALRNGKNLYYVLPNRDSVKIKQKQLERLYPDLSVFDINSASTAVASITLIDLEAFAKVSFFKHSGDWREPRVELGNIGQNISHPSHKRRKTVVIFDEANFVESNKIRSVLEECISACSDERCLLVFAKLIPNSDAFLRWMNCICGPTDLVIHRKMQYSKYFYAISDSILPLFCNVTDRCSIPIESATLPPFHLVETDARARNQHFQFVPLNTEISDVRRETLTHVLEGTSKFMENFRRKHKNRERIRVQKKLDSNSLKDWLNHWVDFQLKRGGQTISTYVDAEQLELLEAPSLEAVVSKALKLDPCPLVVDAPEDRCDAIANILLGIVPPSDLDARATVRRSLEEFFRCSPSTVVESEGMAPLLDGIASYHSKLPASIKDATIYLLQRNLIRVIVTSRLLDVSCINRNMTCILPNLGLHEGISVPHPPIREDPLPEKLALASSFKKVIYLHKRTSKPHETALALIEPIQSYKSHLQLSFGSVARLLYLHGSTEDSQEIMSRTYLYFLQELRQKHQSNLEIVDPLRRSLRINELLEELKEMNVSRKELQSYASLYNQLQEYQNEMRTLVADDECRRRNAFGIVHERYCKPGMIAELCNGVQAIILDKVSKELKAQIESYIPCNTSHSDMQHICEGPGWPQSNSSEYYLVLTRDLEMYSIHWSCLDRFSGALNFLDAKVGQVGSEPAYTGMLIRVRPNGGIHIDKKKIIKNTLVSIVSEANGNFGVLPLKSMEACSLGESKKYRMASLPLSALVPLEILQKDTPWRNIKQERTPLPLLNQKIKMHKTAKRMQLCGIHNRKDISRLMSIENEINRLERQTKRGGRDNRRRQVNYLSRLYGEPRSTQKTLHQILNVLKEYGAVHHSRLTPLGTLCASLNAVNELWLAVTLLSDELYKEINAVEFAALISAVTFPWEVQANIYKHSERLHIALKLAEGIANRMQRCFDANELAIPLPLNSKSCSLIVHLMENSMNCSTIKSSCRYAINEVDVIGSLMQRLSELKDVSFYFEDLLPPKVVSLIREAYKIMSAIEGRL